MPYWLTSGSLINKVMFLKVSYPTDSYCPHPFTVHRE